MAIPEIIAAAGMKGLLALQRVAAENLANASTPGFKKLLVAMRSDANGMPVPNGAVDLSGGALESTGNPLDVAIDGPGFFVARGAQGDHLLRGGSWVVNRDGKLATQDGALLVGEDGRPLSVSGGTLTIGSDGTVSVDGNAVGKLRRVDVAASQLTHVGSLLQPKAGVVPTPTEATVRSGYLEQSNVQTVGEMVQMIQTLRSFDLLGQVAKADDEMQQRLSTDVARVQ